MSVDPFDSAYTLICNILSQLEKSTFSEKDNIESLNSDIELLKKCARKTVNPTLKKSRLESINKITIRLENIKKNAFVSKPQAIIQVKISDYVSDSQHKSLLQEQITQQDEHLDELSNMLTSLKDLSYNIKNELEQQNEIIDDTTQQVEKTTEQMNWLTKSVKRLSSKVRNDTCCQFSIIIVCSVVVIILGVSIFI